MEVDIGHLRTWIGRSEECSDEITPTPIAALAATLNRDDPFPRHGDILPPFWHRLNFRPICKTSDIGSDGHPKRGGFLPPVPLPRRMYAGARLDFHRPLRVGEAITRVSTIADVTHKVGRTGALVFVLVRHQISNGSGLAITEEHDIVYREPSSPDSSSPVWQKAPENATWTMEICPNEVILFRYSALLFVSHRIHYDRRYVTDVEGYPGLVVHGPLIATFLLELLRQNMPSATLARFSFRALKPLYDNVPFTVSARIDDDQKTVHLWAASSEGFLAMDATVMLGDTLKG